MYNICLSRGAPQQLCFNEITNLTLKQCYISIFTIANFSYNFEPQDRFRFIPFQQIVVMARERHGQLT